MSRDRNFPLQQAGFSLVELMIAMAIGLVVVAAVGTLSLNATRSYRAMNRSSEVIENGRYALKIIKDDLEHAGFYGAFNPLNASPSLPASQPDPCAAPTSAEILQRLASSFLLPVAGTCSATLASKVSGTNALIFLRANTQSTSLSVATNSTNTYLQTTPDEYIMGIGTNLINKRGTAASYYLQKPDGSTADIRQLHVHLYYIRSYSQTGDGIPTLVRKAPIDSDSNAQALIEGIENLQIQYGIDGNQDGSPDTYSSTPSSMTVTDWSNVVSAKLFLLARSLEADRGYTDTKTYDLGNLTVTPGGPYHRRVFSQVVRLINVSERRER